MIKEDLKENLKELVGPIVFLCGITALIILLITVQRSLSRQQHDEQDFVYVSKIILPDTIPVNKTQDDKISIPYKGENIKQVRDFYVYKKESKDQQNSLIFYDNTYIQNSGVDYSGDSSFDVVSVLDGTVISIKEDQMLGNVVEIKHSNELISVYQSLSEINVEKDETVTKDQVIGKSGTYNIAAILDDHLHFELYYKGQVVNPNEYLGKTLKELN